MDPQVVSVAAGVVGVAIAALGLLLSWYRREGQTASDKEERRRQQIFRAISIGIIASTVIGVAFTFALGENSKSSQVTQTTVGTEPTSTKNSNGSMELSRAQYVGRVGKACSEAMEKGRRLSKLRARETVLGAAVKVEEEELDEISNLQPPEELKALHSDMVSTWRRRISLLESVYQRLPEIGESQGAVELMAADQLADELAVSFKTLELPECIM